MNLTEYREAFGNLPVGALSHDLAELLTAVGGAWAQAEDATISENEARRWSPVCEAAARIVEQAATR